MMSKSLTAVLAIHSYFTCLPGELSAARRDMDGDLDGLCDRLAAYVDEPENHIEFAAALQLLRDRDRVRVLSIDETFTTIRIDSVLTFTFVGLRTDLTSERVMKLDLVDVASAATRGVTLNKSATAARIAALRDEFDAAGACDVVFNGFSRGGLRAIEMFLSTALVDARVSVVTFNCFVGPAALERILSVVGSLPDVVARMLHRRVHGDIGLGHKLPGEFEELPAPTLPSGASKIDRIKAAHTIVNALPPLRRELESVAAFERSLDLSFAPILDSNVLYHIGVASFRERVAALFRR